MLKQYFFNGKKYQFEEKEAPAGAVEVVKTEIKAVSEPPKTKAITSTKNKTKKVK